MHFCSVLSHPIMALPLDSLKISNLHVVDNGCKISPSFLLQEIKLIAPKVRCRGLIEIGKNLDTDVLSLK